MSRWKIVDTGEASANENMRLDARLLEDLVVESRPVLHLYSWSGPCATYGHFINPYSLVKKPVADTVGLELARRPTGGGMIFHMTDFAFSVLIPATHPSCSLNTLDNYSCVNRLVADVVWEFLGQISEKPALLQSSSPSAHAGEAGSFCMAKPTIYDVMLEGKKVGGAAQRRTKYGFLHQGSISLALPNFTFLESLLSPEIVESMRQNSYALVEEDGLEEARLLMKSLFIENLQRN